MTWIDEIKNELTPQLVGALLSVEDKILANPDLYRNIFRDIPLDQVVNLSQRNKFIQIWRKIEPIPLQNWPQKITVKADVIQESPLAQTGLDQILSRDPLQHIFTEDEETTLFIQDGFWFEHPAYSTVANATQLQVVYGPPGCGRTALAKGLSYNESRWSRYFWYYRSLYSGFTDISTLRESLVEQMLQYTLDRPTLLLPLQEYQRKLIAEILVGSLTKQYVLAQLEQARTSQRWLQNATSEQKLVWQRVGDTELALLLQAVESTVTGTSLTEFQWARMLVGNFQALDFRGVRLVLDCQPDTAETISALLPTLQEWQQSGLITTLFVPDGERYNLPGVAKVPLTWSQPQLEALFSHRLLRLANFSLPKTAPFASDSVYNSFMATASTAPATPRRLANLWQAALSNLGDEEAIRQAALSNLGDGEAIRQAALSNLGDGEAISMDVLHKAAETLHKREEAVRSTEAASQVYNLERLQALLDEHFSDEEIRNLCPALGVDYDNLSGANKRGKIRELVLFMNRSGRLSDLVERCQAERPFINWG